MAAYGLLLAAILRLRAAFGLEEALGSDAAMWGLSAMGLLEGRPPQVAPLFPALVALLSALSQSPVWRVGGLFSALCGAALPVLLFVACRDLGSGRWTALVAAALCLLLPDVAVFAFQLQPDALAALLLLASAWLGLRWERAPSRAALLAWLSALVLLALTREHGQVLIAGLPLYLLARRRPRVALALVLVSCALLAGLVRAGALSGLPERIAQPLLESPFGAGQGAPPHFYSELRRATGEGHRLWEQGRVLPVLVFNLQHLLARHLDNLWLLGLGGLGYGALARRRGMGWAGLLALLPTAVILLVWSNQRHSALLLPVGLLGIACGVHAWRRGSSKVWIAFAALAMVGGGWSMRDAAAIGDRLLGAAHHARGVRRVSEWLVQVPGEWALGGLDNEVNLYLGWPRIAVDHTACALLEDPGGLWRSLWIAPPGVMATEWEQLHEEGPVAVYVLQGPSPRPCAERPLPKGPNYAKAGQSMDFDCKTPVPLRETQPLRGGQRCWSAAPGPGRPPPPPPAGGGRRAPPARR